MKKSLLAACVLSGLTTFSAQSQVTIDSSDYGSIGDTVYLGIDSMPPGIMAGPSGVQTWDFSSLLIDYYDSLFFLPATDSNFPASNLAVKSKYATPYYIKTQNELSLDGVHMNSIFGFPISFTANYEDNQMLIGFNSTYLDVFTDVAKIDTIFRDPQFSTYIDSANLIRNVFVNSTIDGHGWVKTPGDADSAIRQYRVEITIDTLCFKGGIFGPAWTCPSIIPIYNIPNPIIDTVYIYTWWAKNKKYPLVELRTDKTGDTVRVANFIIGNTVTALPGSTVIPSCYGSCDGQASVLTMGGVAPVTYLWDAPAGNQTTQTATGLCAGSYFITLIDAINDSSIAKLTVNNPAALTMTINSKVDSINCDTCKTGSITVEATGGTPGTPAYTYTWSNGFTGGSVTGLVEGTYSVTVTDANGCTSNINNISIDLTGLYEITFEEGVIVFYPNPVQSALIVSNGSRSEWILELSDYTGKVILYHVAGEGITTVPVNSINPGLYLLRFKSNGGDHVHTGRIAIMR